MATVIVPDGPGYGLGVRYFGDVDPDAVGAFAGWFDTATGALKFRNAADTAWIAVAVATPDLAAVLAVGAAAGGGRITGLGGFSGNNGDAMNFYSVKSVLAGTRVRAAAGVPSGVPLAGELALAVDTTVSPGTLYFWDGSAWNAVV